MASVVDYAKILTDFEAMQPAERYRYIDNQVCKALYQFYDQEMEEVDVDILYYARGFEHSDQSTYLCQVAEGGFGIKVFKQPMLPEEVTISSSMEDILKWCKQIQGVRWEIMCAKFQVSLAKQERVAIITYEKGDKRG